MFLICSAFSLLLCVVVASFRISLIFVLLSVWLRRKRQAILLNVNARNVNSNADNSFSCYVLAMQILFFIISSCAVILSTHLHNISTQHNIHICHTCTHYAYRKICKKLHCSRHIEQHWNGARHSPNCRKQEQRRMK